MFDTRHELNDFEMSINQRTSLILNNEIPF